MEEVKVIPPCYYRISVKSLILDAEKRFLLCQENDGIWELPGGGLDFGESPRECMVRELKEETGFEITSMKDHPSYFVTGQDNNGKWKALAIYEVKVKDLNFTPSDECIAVKFYTAEEALKLNEALYPLVKEFAKQYNLELH